MNGEMSSDSIDLGKLVLAQLVACSSHGKQIRKNSGIPYITHPSRVANSVSTFLACYLETIKIAGIQPMKLVDLYCAAYLHDTLEDTELTESEILCKFGADVLNLVKELTSDPIQMATFPSKGEYLLHKMQYMSPHALFIKLLDRLDNITDYKNDAMIDKSVLVAAKKYADQTQFMMNGLENRASYSTIIKLICATCKQINTIVIRMIDSDG